MSASDSSSLSVPSGGGAVGAIGETFQANAFSGTGRFSIPIAVSPGRGGFGPQLILEYNTGHGNGLLGLGWTLAIPRISRKTEEGIPRYVGPDEDVFVLSGAEDLVVALRPGTREPDTETRAGFSVTRYRPRTEGLFARIEKWVAAPDGDTHWRVTTTDNRMSVYGRTRGARVVDHEAPTHVFEWLLQESFDAKGNHILYEYAVEDPALALGDLRESNRRYAQVYVRRIFYGNTTEPVGPARKGLDHEDQQSVVSRRYLFEVVFDYGDRPGASPAPPSTTVQELTTAWPVRPDPFSSFRAGFEVRTLRRCERVLMCHHFDETGHGTIVKSSDFTYETDSETRLSFLGAATVTSYRRRAGGYDTASLPPVTFSYSAFKPDQQRYQSISVEGGELPPSALSNPQYSLLDLFGDGLPDVVHSGQAGIRYWRNLGGGKLDRPRTLESPIPIGVTLSQPGVALADFGGDGLPDLFVHSGSVRGFWEMTPNAGWTAFRPFLTFPSVDLADPQVRQLDLTGDGLIDILETRDHHFLWFRCLGEEGFAKPVAVERIHDLNRFPDVFFNDPDDRVRLADMTGDGLNDIVLVHSGHIEYWPNLGYGRFGPRITMEGAPRFEEPFDHRRLHFVNLDGSGCADLVYVDVDRVHFWFNQSGNGWSDRRTIHGTPVAYDPAAVRFSDFFGAGTTALVWSYDARTQGTNNYKVLDLCGGVKPYLLTSMSNNMGATTRVRYGSSTRHCLDARARSESWATALPFPVQVVDQTEVVDHIGRTKLVTSYSYQHGYFDGAEREFRGFGRVDRCDTEAFETFAGSNLHEDVDALANASKPHHVPATLTRSWFHTGAWIEGRSLSARYADEFYSGDPDAFEPGEHLVEEGRSPRAAHRALRGQFVRSEVYALDGTVRQAFPYVVVQNRCRVRQVQPSVGSRPPVLTTSPLESFTYQYERYPGDPRVVQEVTLRVDDFGNVIDRATVAYPRRVPAFAEQGRLQVQYTHTDFINSVAGRTHYYAGVACQVRLYEVTGLVWNRTPIQADAFQSVLVEGLAPGQHRPYEWRRSLTWSGVEKRIVSWTRRYFRRAAAAPDIRPGPPPTRSLADRLPLGAIARLGLPYESYRAAFSTAMIRAVFEQDNSGLPRVPADMVVRAGYCLEADVPDLWWKPSGQHAFDPQQFYLPVVVTDPFGATTTTVYDRYALLVRTATDAVQNTTTAENDYRLLQPRAVVDSNGNRTEVAVDTLGLVVGAAVAGQGEGDSLSGFVDDLPPADTDVYSDQPLDALKKATSRTVYDVGRYYRIKQQRGGDHDEPNLVLTLTRETRAAAPGGAASKVQQSFAYADGFGRFVQTKVLASHDAGAVAERWIGSGWTIFNN